MNPLCLIGVVVAAAGSGPVSLSIAPTSGGTDDAPVLDRLLATAAKELERDALGRVAEPADVVLEPSLLPLLDGRVRVVLELRARVRPDLTDRLGFELTAGRFGPAGARMMVRAAAERATRLKERLDAPSLMPEDAPTAREPARASEPAAAAAERPVKSDWGRLRIGVSSGAGLFMPGPMFAVGAELRVGWQLKQWLGVYVAGGGRAAVAVGGSIDPSAGAVTASGGSAAFWYATAMAELIGGDLAFLAAGAGIAHGGWAFFSQTVGSDGSSQNAQVSSGWMPAVDVKLGLGFGAPNKETGRRHQFTLAVDLMMVIAPRGANVGQSAGMGGVQQGVERTGAAVGFAPVLLLGYEMR